MTTTAATSTTTHRSGQLLGATWAFAINFWAWNLIGPLSSRYAGEMSLTATQTSLLVATPVLVGSLGRIPVGALTDRYGGRLMFAVISVVSIVPVLAVGFLGQSGSYGLLVVCAFFLGIPGTAFSVGVPFVNAWYPPARRGFATGVFGIGMGGTALSAFFTPRFVQWFGYLPTHLIVAAALAVSAAVLWVVLRDADGWTPNRSPVGPKLLATVKLGVTWRMALLYAVTFGGFVAFSTYLPTYLKAVYDFSITDAGTRTAGFAIAAVLARPLGGVLSDRWHPKRVVMLSLTGAAAMALVVAAKLPAEIPAGAAFVVLALFLGIGTGGVFAWVARLAPAGQVGSVTGIVGAAGGLGGYFPPLVMGATYDAETHSYSVGLALLSATCLLTLAYVALRLPGPGRTTGAPTTT